MVQFSEAVGFWPAALLSSAAFAAAHLGNAGETPLGIINAGLFGLVLAYSLKRTGSLWFALGFHAAWNFTQSSVLGLANSVSVAQGRLFDLTLSGPDYLTGGNAGPEGSVIVTLATLFLAILLRLTPQTTR